MSPASLSNEARIANGLRLFGCSGRSFVEIAKSLGVPISHGPFSEQMKASFHQELAEKLLEVLARMADLQDAVEVPVDWTRTERIASALTVRLVARIAAQSKDIRFDEYARTATKLVVQ